MSEKAIMTRMAYTHVIRLGLGAGVNHYTVNSLLRGYASLSVDY